MMTKTPVSCEVIQDLLPLVEDGVASEDSCKLVKQHLSQCSKCTSNSTLELVQTIPDERLLQKIQTRLTRYGLVIILLGAILGSSLSYSMNLFNNVLLMPFLGALCFILLKKYWLRGLLSILATCYISIILISLYQQQYNSLFSLFVAPLYYLVIYGVLLLIGVLIGKLLHFALKGS